MPNCAKALRATCLAAVSCATVTLLSGCVTGGYDSFQYHETHEIPLGPGLISDDSGDYTLAHREFGGSSAQRTASSPVRAPSSGGLNEASTPE